MKNRKSAEQARITGKKKKLSAGNKNLVKGTASSIPKSSIEGKEKKSKRAKDFPIVAIGASAGGLEAISKLLENLSPNLGMCYVIIQHLAPDHESILPELLERKTSMPVHQVKDGMMVKSNNVYVIPPNTYMSITDGHLKLSPRIKADGVYHSIDFFLNALAPVYKNKAIAVILSGSATDGSLGVQTIKAEGGITFAQDESAKFLSMPLSAIDSGFIDFILSPKEIAKQLENFPKIIYSIATINKPAETSESELKKIYFMLHNKHGVDFSYYKPNTINRRIQRRMLLHKKIKAADYIKFLRQNTGEVELLYRDLLINVTSFFREPRSYVLLTEKIFPALMKHRDPNDALRIWVPACSSGEETYSIAICLFELLKERSVHTPIQIFATDINEKAIEKARMGIYSKASLEKVSPKRLKDYFIKLDDSYQIVKSIRDICVFAQHNLLKDPPFSRMDLISCQNVMIYLENAGQKKILTTFHYALKPAGYLLLGKSETISSAHELFTVADEENKIYKRKQGPANGSFTSHPNNYYPREASPDNKKNLAAAVSHNNFDKEIEKILLSRHIPASVVVDKDMLVQRFLGTASHYLQPASGKASLHLLKLVRDDLAFDLRKLVNRAKKEKTVVKRDGIVISDNGQSKEMEIEVTPLKTPPGNPHFLILFKESRRSLLPVRKDKRKTDQKNVNEKRISELELELADAKEHLKILTEEFEAAHEELQSSTEEVLSSNEELQSINEELETSKEELQSTNEELVTINEELQIRNTELKELGEFKKAIIETIHESLVILTIDLHVKSANKGFYRTFHTTQKDTEDKYFFELGNHQWNIPKLRQQLIEVQTKNIEVVNFEVSHKFPTIGQKIMLLNAQKINFSESESGSGSGSGSLILLAIEDITDKKMTETKIKESEERFKLLLQNAFDIITVFDPDGTIQYESPAIEKVLGYTPEERMGKNIIKHSIVHPDDKRKKIQMLERAVASPGENINVEFRLQHKDGSYRTIDAVSRNMMDDPRINGIIATYRDITDRKNLEQQKDEFIGIASHELKTPVTSIKAYSQILQDVFSKAHDNKSVELLHKMETQVDRLNLLIVDLLDFTRIEGGKLKFREENYNMNELIKEVAEEMQRASKTHKIILKLGEEAELYGDRYRVGQVITNLLGNAIKYSPGAKKVVVSSKIDKGTVIVCIQDFGIGIDEKLVDKVFDKFFRVTEPLLNTFPGLGLGLYIAAEIVKRQGGCITVTSTKGEGATFCFSLPLRRTGK